MKKIAIFGKNDIAVKLTQFIVDSGECEIIFVSPAMTDKGEDTWQLSLKKYAQERDLPIKLFTKIKSADSLDYLIDKEIDFIFSFQYDQIINQKVIDSAKFGIINLHFGPLPRYRGVSTNGLAILNGEKEFGVTLHYIDPGVDTGDVIDQTIFDIKNIENARHLYNQCVLEGVDLFKKNFESILNCTNTRTPQDNSKALYNSIGTIDFSKNEINWKKDTNSLTNWIKAFIFEPIQFPRFTYEGKEYFVEAVHADFTKNNFEKPGTVIEQHDNYFKIATHDAYIDVYVKV